MTQLAPPARRLSPRQERGLALGAVFAVEDGLPFDELTAGLGVRSARRVLSRDWGVDGPTDVSVAYAFLLGGGHQAYYAAVNPAVEQYRAAIRRNSTGAFASGQWVPTGIRRDDQAAAVVAAAGLDTQGAWAWFSGWCASIARCVPAELSHPLPASIVAWDAARVVHVSRLMADARYVDEQMAHRAIAQAVALCRPAYASWQEFGNAFVIGRAFWRARDPRDPFDRELGNYAAAAERLARSESSPWGRTPW